MTITQLTTNGTAERPDISGNEIVWTQNDNEIVLFDGTNSTILPNLGVSSAISPQISADGVLWNGWVNGWHSFYYDGNTTTQLTNYKNATDEKLSGNRIAWRNAPEYTPSGELEEVYLYDGTTQTTLQLTDNNSRETSVDISGQNVVWNGVGNTIYLYDGTSTTTLPDTGVSPHVSGNQVVWESYTGGRKDQINLYDGNSISQIVNNDTVWLQGFFDGNVVWTQWDGNDYELFRYDGNTTLQITDNDFNDRLSSNSVPGSSTALSSTAVDGSGDNLVWSSYVDDNWEIFYYDGTQTIQITDNDIDDLNPKISGDRVVWSTGGTTSDVFLYEPSVNSAPDPDSVEFSDDFDPDLDSSQWQQVSNGVANGNFNNSGNSLYFSGGSSGGNTRFATSKALDLREGGSVVFDLIFGTSSNGGENADAGEDVVLEYSIDDGANWSNLGIYDTEAYTAWTTVTRTIPAPAQTEETLLRWRQVRYSGSSFDNWGLDNVLLAEKLPSLDLIADNFDPDLDNSQWTNVGSSDVNSNFGGSGNSLFFTGGNSNDNSRSLTTQAIDVALGGDISFELIFGNSSNGGENADAGEDVRLEYSVDDGTNWQQIAIYDTEDYTSWTGISESIPIDAQTDSTLFRWTQVRHSGSSFDNWGLDNVLIEPSDI